MAALYELWAMCIDYMYILYYCITYISCIYITYQCMYIYIYICMYICIYSEWALGLKLGLVLGLGAIIVLEPIGSFPNNRFWGDWNISTKQLYNKKTLPHALLFCFLNGESKTILSSYYFRKKLKTLILNSMVHYSVISESFK